MANEDEGNINEAIFDYTEALVIVVGFAGLLDIGYVALRNRLLRLRFSPPHFGIHLPALVILPILVAVTAIAGVLIGARRCACVATISRS
jgi:hypothetical protein